MKDIKDLEDLWRGLMIDAYLKGFEQLVDEDHYMGEYRILIDCTLLQKWLREEHKIDISINKHQDSYWFSIENTDTDLGDNSYEKGLVWALIDALKLIK